MIDNTIILVDESGKEETFNVVLTFSHPETNNQYVIFEKQDSEDDHVYAYRYDEENNLYPIETDEEWSVIEEVLETFNNENEEE